MDIDTVAISGTPPYDHHRPRDPRSRFDDDPDAGWAIVAHLLGLFCGPLIGAAVLLIAGRRSSFVRQHARQAVNFQLNLAAGTMAIVLLQVLLGFRFAVLFPLVGVAALVYPILASVRARRGTWMPYPQLIPFLRTLPEPTL